MHESRLGKTLQWLGLSLILAVLFFYKLGYPARMIFDEVYHIASAQKYIHGVFFQENHPPLGKMLIALGEVVFDDDQNDNYYVGVDKISGEGVEVGFWGYRFFPALFGFGSILLFVLLMKKLLEDQVVAYLLGLIGGLDTAFLIQSRSASLDSFLVFFILLNLLLFFRLLRITKKRDLSRWHALTFGLAMVSAVLVKATGLIVLLLWPILTYHLWQKFGRSRVLKFLVVAGGVAVVVYSAVWSMHYSLGKKLAYGDGYYGASDKAREWIVKREGLGFVEARVVEIEEAIRYSDEYNQNVPALDMKKVDEVGSPWFMWPLGGRTINYRWETPDSENYRFIYLVGNPVVWSLSLLGVVLGTSWVVGGVWCWYRPKKKVDGFVLTLVMMYWAYMFPFMFLIKRVMYLYHYLPALFLGLLILGLVVDRTKYFFGRRVTSVRKRGFVWGLLIVTVAAFWIYKPFVYYLPLNRGAFYSRAISPTWMMDFPGD